MDLRLPPVQRGGAMTALFEAGPYRAFELGAEDIPRLQRFYDENPEYHQAVEGVHPGPDTAREEFHSLPPPGWPFTRKWVLAFEGEDGAMAGMAGLLSDLHAPTVWHVGLFIVATHLHGSGTAHRLHAALEAWTRVNGARWLRLGVVEGNTRAERFWEKTGYVEVRKRHDYPLGGRMATLRMMVKLPAGGTLEEYLARVPRDRPESP
jgi:GNAT superfamily N-acetyltransferase